ncbi:unnamed protein product [Rotaria sp. Silwood2]|nr:unnamed protein product [Rotaria sp. Silwood2]CAF4504433.1 unnamed protein product [Rotaria sp. Silwood2]
MCAADPARLNKKDIERLIEENNTSLSYLKPKESKRMSKYWSKFSQIYISNIKQDFIICDSCKNKESNSFDQQRKLNHYYNSTLKSKNLVPKPVNNAISLSCVEFVVEDGRTFHLLQGSGFVSLAKQLFDAGKLISSSIDVDVQDLLPDPTAVTNFYSI